MATIIDRRDHRGDKDKSTSSRQKFIKRSKRAMREAVERSVQESGGFTDIVGGSKNKRKSVKIKNTGIDEPVFSHSADNDADHVITGNDQYVVGDLIEKPNGGGRGNDGSPDGDGEDDFAFYLNRDEFLNILFEDLELPDMIKRNLIMTTVERVPDGFAVSGAPPQLDLPRTFRNSLARRVGLNRKPLRDEITALENELALAIDEMLAGGPEVAAELQERIVDLKFQIERLKQKVQRIPFIDPLDLRYRKTTDEIKPTVSAVMFCLMDVSASMGEHEKTIAKYFYFLLWMFLQRNYDRVHIIFIRHTHDAKEVDEQEFFYGRDSGGTVVSTALDLCYKIIKERYDTNLWNIYVAQASDGDNWNQDTQKCLGMLDTQILPVSQYYVYVQIDHERGELVHQHGMTPEEPTNDMWRMYKSMQNTHKNFEMRALGDKKDIYPVFRQLFEKNI